MAAGTGPAAAEPAGPEVAVTADFHDPGQPGFSNYAPVCGPEQPSVCSFGFDGRVDWTGGMSGSSVYHAIGYGTPAGELRWEVWETFTGTVAGCGSGTLSWHGAGSLDLDRLDPATQTVPMEGVLDVGAPTSGDLAGVVGRLELVDTTMRLAPAFAEQHGKVAGEVSCARGPAAPASPASDGGAGERAAVLGSRAERAGADPALGAGSSGATGGGQAVASAGPSRSGNGLATTGSDTAALLALGLVLIVAGTAVRRVPRIGPVIVQAANASAGSSPPVRATTTPPTLSATS
jgi:hypothetical protein